ncbi:DNA topoisomerase (ATP-hydrolyzing) subunit B [Candidatus Saganbacteria bacterium]|nr:DNA topoisomerase (ATP-hydrolyzing) subunit B [Candidatus Saganbacteria bacterium]
MAKQKDTSQYDASKIKILGGIEAVRKRPAMYIGSTGKSGLHHLIYEVVDNSIDEALAGYCDTIGVTIHKDNSVTVEDNGRGIPIDMHKEAKKPAAEVVLTTLHAGGKFGGGGYKVSGGLHGVGVSVVNALSEWMEVEIKRDSQIYRQRFERGDAEKHKIEKYKGDETGTVVTFLADPKIFSELVYDYDTVKHRLQELAFLNKGLKIGLIDEREKEKVAETFEFEGGVIEFIEHLNKGKEALYRPAAGFSAEKENVFVEVGLQHCKDYYDENLYSYVNCIRTKEGGTHVVGFKSALTRVVNTFGHKNGLLKEAETVQGEDIREGLTVVINTRVPDPQFEGQTKTKLGNGEVKGIVDSIVVDGLSTYLDKNPAAARAMIEKSILAFRVRMAARKAQELERKKSALDTAMLPGKLADCSESNAAKCELFIVEGDSAGGCFSSETKVALTDGSSVSFIDLVKEYEKGKQNYCYTIKDDGNIGIERILNPRITKKNAEVIKVILDNNEEIVCTPDHKFMLRDFTYVEAKNLAPDMSLMPLYIKNSKKEGRITIEGYEMALNPKTHKWIFTHLLSDRYNLDNAAYSIDTGLDHSLHFFKQVLEKRGEAFYYDWDRSALKPKNTNLLSFQKLKNRFFAGDENMLLEAAQNYNHKIKRIERLKEKVDVYDIEVPCTHNFALSAGIFVHNSAKQGRNRKFQAILPLKGKILNVEKARLDKILANNEIRTMITAIGPGVVTGLKASGNGDEEKETDRSIEALLKELRYHKIILMTDADVDGSHIRTLLLTFYYRYAREIVENGNIFIAQPPLYLVRKGKNEKYCYSDAEMSKIVKEMGSDGVVIQRYKGLGEMNPEQLWETTLNPDTRTLLQVTLEDAEVADEIFTVLMGSEVEPRRAFIEKHAKDVKRLDV